MRVYGSLSILFRLLFNSGSASTSNQKGGHFQSYLGYYLTHCCKPDLKGIVHLSILFRLLFNNEKLKNKLEAYELSILFRLLFNKHPVGYEMMVAIFFQSYLGYYLTPHILNISLSFAILII